MFKTKFQSAKWDWGSESETSEFRISTKKKQLENETKGFFLQRQQLEKMHKDLPENIRRER